MFYVIIFDNLCHYFEKNGTGFLYTYILRLYIVKYTDFTIYTR